MTIETAHNAAATGADTKPRLPVTLLSGFLGSGKTTMLEHILSSPKHGLCIGVIVNDVGALNIDAALIANHRVSRTEEQVVAMQNGCICCTLRGDLLEEVARLADKGQIEYLLIESSGVSEPMQVAETFSEDFAEMHVAAAEGVRNNAEGDKATNARLADILAAGGLSKIARLDTCVTVVDAVNFMADYATADFLVDRHDKKDVPEEDDRNISDLQTDQVEFADVIVINKCDLVSKDEVERVRSMIKALNPAAKVLTTVYSKLDVKDILDTNLFSYSKAVTSAGWLRSLQEEINPETEEYGIGTFVYRAHRPFHPARLWETIKSVFVVIQESYEDEDGEPMNEDSDGGSEGASEDEDMSGNDGGDMDLDARQPQLNPKARLATKQADPTFGPLLRSKGFLWLATRPAMFGEWSQAGVMLTIGAGDKWRCEVPEDQWPDDEKVRASIRADFHGEWRDRRQEIVFIGQRITSDGGEARIRVAMDKCLLTDKEFAKWERAMRGKDAENKLLELFEDGFEDWPGMSQDHDHDHDHPSHKH